MANEILNIEIEFNDPGVAAGGFFSLGQLIKATYSFSGFGDFVVDSAFLDEGTNTVQDIVFGQVGSVITITLQNNVVPEPSTYLLLIFLGVIGSCRYFFSKK